MNSALYAVWRWVKWPLFVMALAYAALVVWRVFVLFDEDKTKAAVAAIHAQRLTLADVMGENLPPVPDQAENDATVAGIDKNNNGVRDDVELAIFEKYPEDKKTRAAALQYAMNQQLYLTSVNNKDTWKAVAEEGDRAYRCIFENFDQVDVFKDLHKTSIIAKEIGSYVFNTDVRSKSKEFSFNYITSYGNPGRASCDVEI